MHVFKDIMNNNKFNCLTVLILNSLFPGILSEICNTTLLKFLLCIHISEIHCMLQGLQWSPENLIAIVDLVVNIN